MSWPDIASAAIEQSPHPLAIIDAEGTVRVANYAFGKLLGRTRRELVDSPISVFLRRVPATGGDDCFAALLAASAKPVQCLATGPAGYDLVFAVDVEPCGAGASRGTLISVRGIVARHGQPAGDVDFEIDMTEHGFGSLRRLAIMGREFDQNGLAGQRCHQLLYNLATPCAACAVRSLSTTCGAVVQVLPVGNPAAAYETVSARTSGYGTALVSRRRLEGDVLSHALMARLDDRARHAGLSAREREVLEHLVRGASLDDIAGAMAIERRTVKFHQTNLLSKLRATSRVDLLRLLM